MSRSHAAFWHNNRACSISMRDFAIAAGLAAAAFGPAAAAPLGLYGVAVLVWGTAVAGVLRQRTAGTPAGKQEFNTNLS